MHLTDEVTEAIKVNSQYSDGFISYCGSSTRTSSLSDVKISLDNAYTGFLTRRLICSLLGIKHLEFRDNYSATSNTLKLVHWPLMYIWYSEEGTGQGPSPPSPLLAVPNVTAHPSTTSVTITVLLYNLLLLCGH